MQSGITLEYQATAYRWDNLKKYLPFYTAYRLWQEGSHYILREGYERSKTTGVGIIDPLPFGDYLRKISFCSWLAASLPRLYVFSGTAHNLTLVADYGENGADKNAREPHARVAQLTRTTTIVNQIGADAAEEKRKITKNLAAHAAFKCAKNLAKNVAVFWDDADSLQNNITYVGAQIIGECFLGVPHFPRHYVPLLRQANDMIASGHASPAEFSHLQSALAQMNETILGQQPQAIIDANGYVKSQLTLTGQESPIETVEKLKASQGGAGFIVESNLSFLLMIALAHISASPTVLATLCDEIHDKEVATLSDLRTKPLIYLDCIYRETLRFASPTAMVPRKTAVHSTFAVENSAGAKSACAIYPNAYLFFAIRPTHHDPKHWMNPHEYQPERFKSAALHNELRFMGKNYFPFSAGKRACPAGSGFVEYAFKGFLLEFFKRYQLTLDKPLESISPFEVHPRWKNDYYAALVKHPQKQLAVTPSP